jgi:hypothetical protein
VYTLDLVFSFTAIIITAATITTVRIARTDTTRAAVITIVKITNAIVNSAAIATVIVCNFITIILRE